MDAPHGYHFGDDEPDDAIDRQSTGGDHEEILSVGDAAVAVGGARTSSSAARLSAKLACSFREIHDRTSTRLHSCIAAGEDARAPLRSVERAEVFQDFGAEVVAVDLVVVTP